jgi:hypothetical protein
MQRMRTDFHLPVSGKSVHGFFSGMRSAALPGRPRLALRRTFSAVLGLLISQPSACPLHAGRIGLERQPRRIPDVATTAVFGTQMAAWGEGDGARFYIQK